MSGEMTTKSASKITFTQFIQSDVVQKTINNVLQDPKRAIRFISGISSAIAVNPVLKTECDPHSVLNAALLGESLGLSPSPQLGHYYMLPMKDKKRTDGLKNATFVTGYKGYLQLAGRSGQYKRISATEVKAGELRSYNPLTDEIELVAITDPTKRALAKTTGYFGRFELLNGFEKTIYFSVEEMEIYADKYSPAFSLVAYRKIKEGKMPKEDMWKYSSFWYTSFDSMGIKTIIRQLLNSGYAPLSIEMQNAIDADEKIVKSIGADGVQEVLDVTDETEDDPFKAIEENAKDVTPVEISDANEDFVPPSGNQLDLSEM